MLLDAIIQAFRNSPILWVYVGFGLLGLLLSTAWFKGMLGEFKVRVLTDYFLGKEYYPVHNVVLKAPDGTTQIDHVLVSPYGVFVIETKNLKGWIFGDEHSKNWTQSLFGRKYSFQNPLRQNFKHVKAVEALLDIEQKAIYSVVVFVGRSKFKTLMPQNVTDASSFLSYIKSKKEILLDEKLRHQIYRNLSSASISSFGSSAGHVRRLKENAKEPVCPKCGVRMVLRTASKGSNAGSQFWGCLNFPKCRITKPI